MVFFQGPLGKSDKDVEKTQPYERTAIIRDTAGALQMFSGKRKLVKLYFEFASAKTRLKVLNSCRFLTKGVEKKRFRGQLRGVRAVFAARGDPLGQG